MHVFNRRLELANCLETDFLKVFHYDFKKYYKETYRNYEYIRLCTIISGEKNLKIKGKKYKYDKDQIMLLSPYAEVEMEIEKPTEAVVIEISDKLIESVKSKVNLDFSIECNDQVNELLLKRTSVNFNKVLKKISKLFLEKNKDKNFLIDLYSQELVYDMLHMKEINFMLNNNLNNPINKSIKIMKENILDKITISDIADELNMSVSNFSSKFKSIVGVSPNVYFRSLKLNEAKKMLKSKSVTQVSSELGYDNISYFIKLFKDSYGITPKQYLLKDYNLKTTI